MESTENYTLKLTAHARKQMEAKGFTQESINGMFTAPENIYPNKKFEGQFRVVGNGICLVGQPMTDRTFLVFTMYEDGVMTPPRADQLDTPEGKAYAKRYEQARAKGNVRRQNEYWPRVHRRNGEMRHTLIK